MGLTVGQAIGIGIVIGFVPFVGALLLFAYNATYSGWVVPGLSQEAPAPPAPPAPPPAPPALPEAPARSASARSTAPEASRSKYREFPGRMLLMCGLEDVEDAVYFERLIKGFARECLIRSYRQPPPVPESLFDEDELVRLAGKPFNGGTWSASISNIATRAPAVRCFLAQFVLKRLDPYCLPQESLLPPEIAGCYQLISTPKDDEKTKDLLGVWRESMFRLLQRPLSLGPAVPLEFKEGDPRKERTRAMVFLIIDALRLESLRTDQGIRNPEFKDALEKRLTGILERAANGGLRLLAQPGEWKAVWEWEKPGFIVFPEIRFVWAGITKLRKRATVIVLPIPSGDNQHPEVDAAEQSNPGAGDLPHLEDGRSLTAKTSQEPGPSTANQ